MSKPITFQFLMEIIVFPLKVQYFKRKQYGWMFYQREKCHWVIKKIKDIKCNLTQTHTTLLSKHFPVHSIYMFLCCVLGLGRFVDTVDIIDYVNAPTQIICVDTSRIEIPKKKKT